MFAITAHAATERPTILPPIQAAIDAAPGGVVHLPPGDYVSGTLRLRDHLVLRLAAGATLIASPDDTAFDPYEKLPYESFADRETTDFSFALLQGRGLQDVSIVGPGRIDGNRRSRGGPKPIALKQCRDVTIRDLTLENAPNYNISLLGCDHVDIRGVTIRNGYSDGIDPDCCRHVRIIDCRVESRDDAIVLKSSLALGVRRSTEYVVVTDCDLVNVRNGLKIGTESSGDFRNIVFRNCTLSGRAEMWDPPPFDVRPFPSAGVSLQNVDGGTARAGRRHGHQDGERPRPLFVRLAERGWGQPVPAAGTLTKITITDVVATGASLDVFHHGRPRSRRLEHRAQRHPDLGQGRRRRRPDDPSGAGAAARVSRRRAIPQSARLRPVLPARDGLRSSGPRSRWTSAIGRPALVLDDVRGATVKRPRGDRAHGDHARRLAALLPRLPAGRRPRAGGRDARAAQRPRDREGSHRGCHGDRPAGRAPRSRRGSAALRTQGNVTSKSWSERRRAAGADSGRPLRLVD